MLLVRNFKEKDYVAYGGEIFIKGETITMNDKKKAYCINCGKKQSYYIIKFSQKVTVRGTTFYYLETKAYCSECGEEVYVKEIADMNAQDRENAYNSYAHS